MLWLVHPGARTFCPLAPSPSRPTTALMSRFHPAQGMKHLREVWTGSLAQPWQIMQKQRLAQEPLHPPSPHTEHRASLSPDTYKLAASKFHPKVKPKHMSNCSSAKSSSICQRRTGARPPATTPSNTTLGAAGPTGPHDKGTQGSALVFPTSPPSLFPLLRSLSVGEQPMGKLS